MDNILEDIKSLLTVEEYEDFDKDIIFHANMSFAILKQLGVGPEKGFRIKDNSLTWTDFLPEGDTLDMAKDYVYLKCKLVFDPPTSGILMQQYKDTINELEQRLYVNVDPPRVETGGETQDEFE